MDLTKLTKTLLSSDSIDELSKLTGASGSDVTNVLANALPTLLDGAKDQAKGKSTSKGFASALSDHAKDNTKDLSSFFGNVDLKDGAKIITHLLGSGKDNVVKQVAKNTGVSKSKTGNILSAVAPLLLSLLGQQADEDDDKDSGVGNLIGSLLGNADVGSLLTGLLTDNSATGKKKKTTKKKASSNGGANLISNLLGSFFK